MSRFLRIWQIIGDKKKGIPPIIPVSRSSWLNGVKSGIYPAPVRIGVKMTIWHEDSIRELEQKLLGKVS